MVHTIKQIVHWFQNLHTSPSKKQISVLIIAPYAPMLLASAVSCDNVQMYFGGACDNHILKRHNGNRSWRRVKALDPRGLFVPTMGTAGSILPGGLSLANAAPIAASASWRCRGRDPWKWGHGTIYPARILGCHSLILPLVHHHSLLPWCPRRLLCVLRRPAHRSRSGGGCEESSSIGEGPLAQARDIYRRSEEALPWARHEIDLDWVPLT